MDKKTYLVCKVTPDGYGNRYFHNTGSIVCRCDSEADASKILTLLVSSGVENSSDLYLDETDFEFYEEIVRELVLKISDILEAMLFLLESPEIPSIDKKVDMIKVLQAAVDKARPALVGFYYHSSLGKLSRNFDWNVTDWFRSLNDDNSRLVDEVVHKRIMADEMS